MAALIYSASMSLDGYIAGPGGDMSWMGPYLGAAGGPDIDAEALAAGTGAMLVGARTYRGDDPNAGTDAEGAFGGTWDGPQIVLTHTPDPDPPAGVSFAGDLRTAVDAARAAAGSARYVTILGADTARQCARAGELDEVMVSILPVMLGGGTRLFSAAGGPAVRLETTRVSVLGPITTLWLRVLR